MIRVFDRLAGSERDLAAGAAVASRFQLPARDGDVAHNLFPAPPGTYLVPDGSGNWTVSCGPDKVSGSFTRGQAPDVAGEARGIVILGRSVADATRTEGGWTDLISISPLEPHLSDKVDLQPFEVRLRDAAGHLEEVCYRPRTHLDVEVERVVVARARRTAVAAPNFLAAHSEDWERPAVRSIIPRRVLAVMRHDEYDIYENRVAVRLVDHLSSYLDRRIRDVARLSRVFEEARDFNSDMSTGSIMRRYRLSSLWGDAADADEALRTAGRTLRQLRRLRQRINALKDSTLYREVPRQASVGASLTVTNILADDPRYRRVAELWTDWARHGREEAARPRERFEAAQELNRRFSQYALLLVARALDQLGCRPVEPRGAFAAQRLSLSHGSQQLTLRFGRNTGVIFVEGPEVERLRILPLCSDLTGLDRNQLRELIREADESATSLIVYPTPSTRSAYAGLEPEIAARLYSLPQDLDDRSRHRAGFLPVSPRDLGSLERVARFVRWGTTARRFLSYPPAIALASKPAIVADEAWIRAAHGRLEVASPPPASVLPLVLSESVAATAQVSLLVAERDAIADRMMRQHKAGHTSHELAAQKRAVTAAIPAAETQSTVLQTLLDGLAPAVRALDDLMQCPSCGKAIDTKGFNGGPGRRFEAHCGSCAAKWRNDACSRCGDWMPVIVPGYSGLQADSASAGWVDRMFGADVLATPQLVAGELRFKCPACGKVSD